MPKFKVDITRTGYAHTTVEIIAKDLFEAREVAQETAGNYSYTEKSAEYEIGTTAEIKEVEPVPHKLVMAMYSETGSGDIDIHEINITTIDFEESKQTAIALYELAPNMICIRLLDMNRNVVFENKIPNYVP